jgi:hypothetical protein
VKTLFWLLIWSGGLAATEIRSGAMLGSSYDQRAFYIRYNPNEPWRKTYSGNEYRPEAQGKLMNVRLAQALFQDEYMTEKPFDPDRNTAAVIDALDIYKRHGVLMINVSLQGAQAGYEVSVNGIDRGNAFRFGPVKGTYVSAFGPDGSLKAAWMARLGRLLRAADQRGMIVNLMYFYQGQDEVFRSPGAMHGAVRSITDWLILNKHRNVLIDVANEYDLPGENWNFNAYVTQNILQLVDDVRQRFHFRNAGFQPPVSASSDGRMLYPESVEGQVDVLLVHGNGRALEYKRRRLAQLREVPRPVLMTEDDNGRESTTANLAAEQASCDLLFREAAGWGYMPWVQAQRFPFRYLPAPHARLDDTLPEKERDMVYFHAVLDHIAGLVLNHSPHE